MNNLIVLALILFLTINNVNGNIVNLTLECRAGSVKCNGICDKPKHIQGCLVYKSRTQCDICQSNYVKQNGICQYRNSPSDKCCEEFDNFGQCKKCTNGFFLNPQTKQCIDIKIPGCLQKSPTGQNCINCASEFIIFNGICVSKIPSCLEYAISSGQYICKRCSQNYDLINNQCSNSQWKNIQQANCQVPFNRNSQNKCVVFNCKTAYQYGCAQCQNGYDLTALGQCILKKNPGCIVSLSSNQCKVCDETAYQLYREICYPHGCSQLNTQNQIICAKCDSRSGFVMENGQCRIPNCLYANSNGCSLCTSGKIWYQNKCINQSQIDNNICRICPSNYFLNSKNQCQIKQQGCAQYLNDKCSACQQTYYFDPSTCKCIKKQEGCIYNQLGQCTSCFANYFFNQSKCQIIGCKTYNLNQRCSECYINYKLTPLGFCTIQNCIQISTKGCLKCLQGFTLTQSGKCQNVDPFCTARNLYNKCIGCQQGYYLDIVSNRCKKSQKGCNYINGRCSSCRTPFVYNPKLQNCFIDGCQKYFFGGCQVCSANYSLRYNSCKLPHCLISQNGKCIECDPDYLMRTKTNQCINKDQFCYQYNKQGECIECAPKYFLSKIQNKCILKQHGCIYDSNDKCSSCIEPFKQRIGKNQCYITGCLQYNFDSCKKCKYPFELSSDKKTCMIKNCVKNDQQKCLQCCNNYIIENGLCTTGDPYCSQYNLKTSQCLRCKQGYKVINNKCQYADAYCLTFTKQGKCMNCINSYFLNQNKMCQLRDPNCQQYINGKCTKCKPFYYQFNSMCIQNSKGCLNQLSISKCLKCQNGYTLNNITQQCQFQIKRLNWNSIDMDFFNSNDQNQKNQLQQTFTYGKQNKDNLIGCYKSGYGKLIYSSDINNIKDVSLDSLTIYGWIPKTTQNQFIGVIVQQRQTFYAIDIKCGTNNMMSSFVIQYLDFNNWRTQGTYNLVCQAADIIKTIYITPVETTTIRIRVKRGLPQIKVQFYFNDRKYITTKPTNQTNIQKVIRQSVQASHLLLTNYCQDSQLCWFGLQICQPKMINGFQIVYADQKTKAKGTINQVYVDYSVDGIQFICYEECKIMKVNDGKFKLDKSVFGSKMRVHIASYQGQPEMRIKFDYQ